MGYKVISCVQPALFLSLRNMYDGLKTLKKTGRMSDLISMSFSMDEYFDLIDFDSWIEAEKKYVLRSRL